MISQSFECLCLTATARSKNSLLEDFKRIREQCPALRELLVPDGIWDEFQRVASEDMDAAQHQSVLLLAFKRGYLSKVTSPVHRYLIEKMEEKPKKQFNNNYEKDLQECWMWKKDMGNVLGRHQIGRGYLGKLTELLCAEWIEEQGWEISNLAALGGNIDIEAKSPDDVDCAIEVKYVGQEDEIFLTTVKSLSGRGGVSTSSLYVASNFLLFRVYEAAKQLEKCNKFRIAILVISNMTWGFVDIPLNENWMCWQSPRFLNGDPDWNQFLKEKRQEKKYSDIENDLAETLRSLKELWIVRENDGFQYSLQHVEYFNVNT